MKSEKQFKTDKVGYPSIVVLVDCGDFKARQLAINPLIGCGWHWLQHSSSGADLIINLFQFDWVHASKINGLKREIIFRGTTNAIIRSNCP